MKSIQRTYERFGRDILDERDPTDVSRPGASTTAQAAS
jgi:hypothetical protein